MHMIHELKEMLCDELEEYGEKGKLDVGDLEIVDKLAHAIKNIDKIIMAKEYGYDDGMHHDHYSGRSRYSHARHRDSMGRYSRADHKELVEDLRDVMEHADETMKGEFESFIRRIEKM